MSCERSKCRIELVELVEISSVSGEEHAVVDHLERRCAELGLPCRRMPVDGGAEYSAPA